MTEQDNQTDSNVRQEKRSKFDQSQKPARGSRRLLISAGLGLLAMVGLYLAWSKHSGSGATAAAGSDGEELRIPIAELADGRAKFYTYSLAGGKQVKLFAVKSSDGVLRTAFDACDVCYEAKRGYTQQGDEMVCNECGRTFPVIKVNTVSGGCNPAPLTRTVQGDHLIIKASDLEKGARYF
jgi:uncharacterized membrane protein